MSQSRTGRRSCFSMALLQETDRHFQALIEDVARKIVATSHDRDGSFISTSLLYPSGSSVVVRVYGTGPQYFITDLGVGYDEAEMMGAEGIYMRHAQSIAQAAGVRFDNQAFFVLKATEAQLPGAVVTVANCSQEAVHFTLYRQSEQREPASADLFIERLTKIFERKIITIDADVIGASQTKWKVAALVRAARRPTIFEPVNKHPTSIVYAATKFHDIARLERAPGRVAIVNSKQDLGTYLGVLSQAADVIEDSSPDQTIRDLARAA